MADSKLATLAAAEDRIPEPADTLKSGADADTVHGGQGSDSLIGGQGNDTVKASDCRDEVEAARQGDAPASQEGAQASAPSPAAPEAAQAPSEPQADPNASKSADEQVDAVVTRMEPEKDEAAANKADQSADTTVSTGALNAGSVDNSGQAPDAVSQATGNSPANKYPAPTPTRDSAVHQLDLKIAELAYFCNDFTHKLDAGRQAMVDAIRAYKPA